MMTNSWMDDGSPRAAYFPNSSWFLEQRKAVNWTQQENKLFEEVLAFLDKDTPDRWAKVAAMIPGKTADDVMSHYQDLVEDVNHIEAGRIPLPGYSSSVMLDWENRQQGYEEALKQSYCAGGKRLGSRPSDHERKKGVPWTEEEHRQFLMGLKQYGKGDWRNISRKFVGSRTPTQVASHAQKYFIRLNSGNKDKRRSSIHDITTVNLPDNRPSAPSQPSLAAAHGTSDRFSAMLDSNQHNEAAKAYSPSAHGIGNHFTEPPYGIKLHAQHLHRGALYDSMVGHHGMLFQMQSLHPRPHG